MENSPAREKAQGNFEEVDKLLAERNRLDKAFQEQFNKIITVMFTDLKGSTAIADMGGNLASRALITHHNEILFPIIKKHNGVLVQTMGDGTMSYFTVPQDAVRAAVEAQKAMDAFNLAKTIPTPILMRIGIHTGQGIVEKNDIFGDVVNTASRFEGQASPGEICISGDTYEQFSDKAEIYCRYIKDVELKGKKEPMKLYKAFWNPLEIEKDTSGKRDESEKKVKKGLPLITKIILFVGIPLIIIFLILKSSGVFRHFSEEAKRSIERSTTPPPEPRK